MFELFKKRDFSAYFSDTISFFKLFGKNYFKNYFIINGIFLMILVVLIYFISKVYMDTIFTAINPGNQSPNFNYIVNYFNNNVGLIIGVLIVLVLLVTLLSLINITYPILYLQLVEKKETGNFSAKEIVSGLKENMGRIILFLLGMIFIITPLMLLVFGLLIVLCFIIIGIPLIMIAMPAFMSWIALSYYEFIIRKVSFFSALNNGLRLVKQQFWTIVGTTFIMFLIVQVIQGFITMIPYFIGLIFMFTSSGNMQGNGSAFSTMSVLMAVMMVFSVLLSYFFNNFLLINQGLIYYSLREQKEDTTSKNQIDLIGTDSE